MSRYGGASAAAQKCHMRVHALTRHACVDPRRARACHFPMRTGTDSSKSSTVMDSVALVGAAGFVGCMIAATVGYVGVVVIASACSCVSQIFRCSGSGATVTASLLPVRPAVSPSSPLGNQTSTAPSAPKAADTLRVLVSAASTDSSCSSSMAGAAPASASMAGAAPAPASAPVRAPVAWWMQVGPTLRARTYLEVTAGVKASHVAVSKVIPVTDAVKGLEASLVVK
jgi:hypothetical protein